MAVSLIAIRRFSYSVFSARKHCFPCEKTVFSDMEYIVFFRRKRSFLCMKQQGKSKLVL